MVSVKDEMMSRIDPRMDEIVIEKEGCRQMDFIGKPKKRYVFISEEGMKKQKDFDYWVSLCLEFNKDAKASKKRPSKT